MHKVFHNYCVHNCCGPKISEIKQQKSPTLNYMSIDNGYNILGFVICINVEIY